MTTRLSDIIQPQVFAPYMIKDTKAKTAIFSSGILREDPRLAQFLAGGGLTVTVPFWNDLDNTDPLIATDQSSDLATVGKVVAGREVAIRNVRTRAWADADLTAELAGADPMQRIGSRVSAYWARAIQRHLVSMLTGVFASNVNGDMRLSIAQDQNGSPTAGNLISPEAILDAAQTMGDAKDSLTTIIMHSVVFTRLQKLNLIEVYIPKSEGQIAIPTYLGYKVVVDDSVRVVQGTTNQSRFFYSTYLVGKGAIAWAEHPVAVPVETRREPAQGNGAGVEQLYTRRQYILHPYGFRWTMPALAQQFPTNPDYANGASWDRAYPERKQIALAELVTNG